MGHIIQYYPMVTLITYEMNTKSILKIQRSTFIRNDKHLGFILHKTQQGVGFSPMIIFNPPYSIFILITIKTDNLTILALSTQDVNAFTTEEQLSISLGLFW